MKAWNVLLEVLFLIMWFCLSCSSLVRLIKELSLLEKFEHVQMYSVQKTELQSSGKVEAFSFPRSKKHKAFFEENPLWMFFVWSCGVVTCVFSV